MAWLRFVPLCCAVLAASAGGCRMRAPIHVWQPPALTSTVGKRVAVSSLRGPDEWSETIQRRLVAGAPKDAGRQTSLVDADELADHSPIRLASASEQEMSDVALASVARGQGFDFMLHGQVVAPEQSAGGERSKRLALSWRLTELSGERPPAGAPLVVELEEAIRRYPDLALIGDPKATLAEAAARETYRLLTPSVGREKAWLAIPYFLPGSAAVRRGNAAALGGDWAKADQIWADAVRDFPNQTAALINRAVAAVAAQDFSRARALAAQAVRRHPSKLARQTLLWVELTQRRYHQAFELPDPPEGWVLTRTVAGGP